MYQSINQHLNRIVNTRIGEGIHTSILRYRYHYSMAGRKQKKSNIIQSQYQIA